MIVTNTGRVIKIAASSIRLLARRPAKGVRLMRLEEGERVVDIERMEEAEEATPEVDDVVGAPIVEGGEE
jgi:DNA gyrase subunit A